jgi:hypothetical protein
MEFVHKIKALVMLDDLVTVILFATLDSFSSVSKRAGLPKLAGQETYT